MNESSFSFVIVRGPSFVEQIVIGEISMRKRDIRQPGDDPGLAVSLKESCCSFLRDDRGSVAMIFAGGAALFIAAMGVAVDYGRSATMQTTLQQSVDSTLQTISTQVNSCLNQNRTNDSTIDTGCLNAYGVDGDGVVNMPGLRSQAEELVRDNFARAAGIQRGGVVGYDPGHEPRLVGDVTLNKHTGELEIGATVGYNCVFMKLLASDCKVSVGAATETEKSFAQSDVLVLKGPARLEFWVDDPKFEGTPADGPPIASSVPPVEETIEGFQLVAEGGWPYYTFGAGSGPGSPPPASLLGLTVHPRVGTMSGVPVASCGESWSAGVGSGQHVCDASNVLTQFWAQDTGDANRSGRNKQLATVQVPVMTVYALGLQLENEKPLLGNKPDPSRPEELYRIIGHRIGGKSDYTFECHDVPAGSWTCDTANGVLEGTPGINPTSGGGGITRVCGGVPGCTNTKPFRMVVTDGRGYTAEASIPYDWEYRRLEVSAPDWNGVITHHDTYLEGPKFDIVATGDVNPREHRDFPTRSEPSELVDRSQFHNSATLNFFYKGNLRLPPSVTEWTGQTKVVFRDTWGDQVTATQNWRFSTRALVAWIGSRYDPNDDVWYGEDGVATTSPVVYATEGYGNIRSSRVTGMPRWATRQNGTSGDVSNGTFERREWFTARAPSGGDGTISIEFKDDAGQTAVVDLPYSIALSLPSVSVADSDASCTYERAPEQSGGGEGGEDAGSGRPAQAMYSCGMNLAFNIVSPNPGNSLYLVTTGTYGPRAGEAGGLFGVHPSHSPQYIPAMGVWSLFDGREGLWRETVSNYTASITIAGSNEVSPVRDVIPEVQDWKLGEESIGSDIAGQSAASATRRRMRSPNVQVNVYPWPRRDSGRYLSFRAKVTCQKDRITYSYYQDSGSTENGSVNQIFVDKKWNSAAESGAILAQLPQEHSDARASYKVTTQPCSVSISQRKELEYGL